MKIYTAATPTQAHILSGLLLSQGIQCEVRGESLFSAKGGLPVTTDTDPYIWLFDKQQSELARKLITEFEAQYPHQPFPAWQCQYCGEKNEGQFGACWQCGHYLSQGDND